MGLLELASQRAIQSNVAKVKSASDAAAIKVLGGRPAYADHAVNGGVIACRSDATAIFVFGPQPAGDCACLMIHRSLFISAEVTANYSQSGTMRIQGRSGSALLGAALLGPAGAVIGGSGGRNAKIDGSIRESGGVLNICLSDVKNPLVTLEFSSIAVARTWCARLNNLASLQTTSSACRTPSSSEFISGDERDTCVLRRHIGEAGEKSLLASILADRESTKHLMLQGWSSREAASLALLIARRTKASYVGWRGSRELTYERLASALMDLAVDGYTQDGMPTSTAVRHVVLVADVDLMPTTDPIASAIATRELNPDPSGGISWLPFVRFIVTGESDALMAGRLSESFALKLTA